ncbi:MULTISPECIES: hypothetical protein [unclassified Imperialibacter]|uniref:hypothetical protein n=1 Tax=unclassified Imperialibacter TaxID=2629706 RepID=UPI001257E232|nr:MULTISPECIES: hypothetical protein [unclassified Imperialibacter]CAD5250718.1 conserved membrane hypothetical protein [Imperialibacter sp. 75]CAD5285947.1 conserved membrane hypothetical protein [Imperialibacter sp. 89]VVT05133.1 conserved membrane hypothetical protein [Imperialibacter sp. EC-SDR9]
MDIIIKKLSDIRTYLKFTYGIVPIVAGADKFTNLLASWNEYLNPILAGMLPFSESTFMILVGIVEIAAGILVFVSPKKGAYIVCAWLVLIAISLLASAAYLDVAVRDLVMAVGAFTFAQLSNLPLSANKGNS